jgi:hypothetical protein
MKTPISVRFNLRYAKPNPVERLARRAKRLNKVLAYRWMLNKRLIAELGTRHSENVIGTILALFDGVIKDDPITLKELAAQAKKRAKGRTDWRECV